MRIQARGNLTVELIRQQRFGDDGPASCHAHRYDCVQVHRRGSAFATPPSYTDATCQRIDRVELSCQALASDPWSIDPSRHAMRGVGARIQTDSLTPPRIDLPPRTISPIVGSPALAGLGIALIVPGTLLDVVA